MKILNKRQILDISTCSDNEIIESPSCSFIRISLPDGSTHRIIINQLTPAIAQALYSSEDSVLVTYMRASYPISGLAGPQFIKEKFCTTVDEAILISKIINLALYDTNLPDLPKRYKTNA